LEISSSYANDPTTCGLLPIVNETLTKLDLSANRNAASNWSAMDCEAHTHIILTLQDEPLSSVLDTTTARDAWDKLLAQYGDRGEQGIIHFIDEVFQSTPPSLQN
jgi:hypothetical protein